ncbi:hypothetical protein [Paraflavitalea speifideaquila]|uniref:hypothetical protein n=1 Tax=Paraflavitalea speifideaquila TaxID=3076558 RepID=UPI0028E5B512|nr:hypothetical protein [Paraflavitalea speifideiaquila]
MSRVNTVSERDMVSVFESTTDRSKNTYINRHYTTNSQRVNITGNLDYAGFKRLLLGRYNLFGVNLQLGQWFNYTRTTDNTLVTDYDTVAKVRNFNSNLSYSNTGDVLEYTPFVSLAKDFYNYNETSYRSFNMQFKLLEDLKTDKNTSSFAKRNLTRSFQFFRYEGALSYQYAKIDKYNYYLSANYTKSMEYPSIDRLYTIVDDVNAYEIRIGNPNLRNSINHAINLNAHFNSENKGSPYAINGNMYGGYYLSLDPVTDSIMNDLSGKRTYYSTNADKASNINLNYNLNISRKINKNNLQLMYNGEFRTGKQPNYIDGFNNISKTISLLNQFTLQFSLSSTLVFTVGRTLQHNKTTPTAPGLNSFKNNSTTSKLGIVVNYPAGFTFSSTVDHIANSNLNKPIVLWNSFATYRFMKQQGS